MKPYKLFRSKCYGKCSVHRGSSPSDGQKSMTDPKFHMDSNSQDLFHIIQPKQEQKDENEPKMIK